MSENFCAQLHEVVLSLPRYQFPVSEDQLPANGIYFIFEKGESGHHSDRIVRIGSHTGAGNLPARLREHITLNKDRSIFRKHIGRAILKRDKDPYLSVWELDFTSRQEKNKHGYQLDPVRQSEIERTVSLYIQEKFSVSVLPTEDHLMACKLEKLCIATVSLCAQCFASRDWLGIHSTKEQIRNSGLWQVQHLRGNVLDTPNIEDIRRLCNKV